ncbi:MAG: class I SAM-dependent methyltransferase [Patescibacteria group bacterium]|jgi:SAM-dependent methyltransferase
MKDFYTQWKNEEQMPFSGWDFSYLKDRKTEELPPWDYISLAKELIKKSTSLLDVATGGGEVLFDLAPLPAQSFAIEGYLPNVEVAQKKLSSLGVKVISVEATDAKQKYPFIDNQFDLVLNRHGGLNLGETYRVLSPGGSFLTQQASGDSLIDLASHFNSKLLWPDNTLSVIKEKAENLGFKIKKAEEWKGIIQFKDVGIIVYFLKAIPWIVRDFSVDKHIDNLNTLQKRLEQDGYLNFTVGRFMILAEK